MISSLLVANRGEIARRIFATCRAMGITTVAVFSDVDEDAPFVREADVSVRLPGSVSAETYLDGERIVNAALRVGADAIHPGYGFLSENESFAERCQGAGIIFVGPPSKAIRVMGSKVEAKMQMEAAGVAMLPSVDVSQLDESSLAEAGARIGYPLLVKPVYGGGGKGIRLVDSPTELGDSVAGARREAAGAFGNDSVFLELYLSSARHVEIQVFADRYGEVVSLFERECSIQRRHQKVIEEAPSVAVDTDLRDAMSVAAVNAVRAIEYVGAGTVEFMLAPNGAFYFLEMNTRLQVEHPVTEAITGLDLVRLQLLIAAGARLPSEAKSVKISGHAIEARLYAEDPERDFLPATGTIHRFDVPIRPGLRVDAAVESGSTVSIYYDPMLAKLIAHAPTREEAASMLASTLASARIHGVSTNRDLLVRLLRHPEFSAGKMDTGFLDRHSLAELGGPLTDAVANRFHALCVALSLQATHRTAASVGREVPSGWRNVLSQMQWVLLDGRWGIVRIDYRFSGDTVLAKINGEEAVRLAVHSCDTDHVDVETEHHRVRVALERVADEVFVDSSFGSDMFRVVPRFPTPEIDVVPGSLLAPMPATVVRLHIDVGDHVDARQVLLVLEAMKMELTIEAPVGGTVTEVFVTEGQQVDAGDPLIVVSSREQEANE